MQITTFEKIQGKLFNVVMVPVTLLAAVAIFCVSSFWKHHLSLATLSFTLCLAAAAYFAFINVMDKPYLYLKKIYSDSNCLPYFLDKKFKTIHQTNFDQLTPNKSIPIPISETLTTSQSPQLIKKPSQKLSKHIAFNPQSEQNIQSPEQQPIIQHTFREEKPPNQARLSQIFQKSIYLAQPTESQLQSTNEFDISNIYSYKNIHYQEIPTRRTFAHKAQNEDYFHNYDLQEESENLKRHAQQIFGTQDSIEESIRLTYQTRYQNYKQTLEELSFTKQSIEKFISETKLVLREKIQEQLNKQFQNLDSIESILKKNFDAHFKSYKAKSNDIKPKTYFGFDDLRTNGGVNQTKNSFTKKQGFTFPIKEKTFSEALQQCVNLLYTNCFDFEYIGEPDKINQVKSELKRLIKQRIELDKFLFIRKSLKVDINLNGNSFGYENKSSGEYEEERYLNMMKLKTLASILGERQAAQQNLLKEFFSNQSRSDEESEQVNSERNIDIVINFYVRVLRQKLSDVGNEDFIKKTGGEKGHYDIVYSIRKEQNDDPNEEAKKEQSGIPGGQNKKKEDKKEKGYSILRCCPGDKNLWSCIGFVRLLISKIGLKKELFPMIKDKELRKDFTRMVEMCK